MISLTFHNDKSQLIRGIAIICMILLHIGYARTFKICVPLFTFLVGYGYNFAKQKDIKHGLKRIWHLLSYYWLILLGISMPIAYFTGNYHPTLGDLMTDMFGLESQLNPFSWYVYFYIYAMFAMMVYSRIISRFKISGAIVLIVFAFGFCSLIRLIPSWSANIWFRAIFDCFIYTPVLVSGYYIAHFKMYSQVKLPTSPYFALLFLSGALLLFLLRAIPYVGFIDFIIIPIFVGLISACFEIGSSSKIYDSVKAGFKFVLSHLGKESMNMWFIHAIFFSTYTVSTAILIDWVKPKALYVFWIILLSYCISLLVSYVYKKLEELFIPNSKSDNDSSIRLAVDK